MCVGPITNKKGYWPDLAATYTTFKALSQRLARKTNTPYPVRATGQIVLSDRDRRQADIQK